MKIEQEQPRSGRELVDAIRRKQVREIFIRDGGGDLIGALLFKLNKLVGETRKSDYPASGVSKFTLPSNMSDEQARVASEIIRGFLYDKISDQPFQ
jgi:hypothetical protein